MLRNHKRASKFQPIFFPQNPVKLLIVEYATIFKKYPDDFKLSGSTNTIVGGSIIVIIVEDVKVCCSWPNLQTKCG